MSAIRSSRVSAVQGLLIEVYAWRLGLSEFSVISWVFTAEGCRVHCSIKFILLVFVYKY